MLGMSNLFSFKLLDTIKLLFDYHSPNLVKFPQLPTLHTGQNIQIFQPKKMSNFSIFHGESHGDNLNH